MDEGRNFHINRNSKIIYFIEGRIIVRKKRRMYVAVGIESSYWQIYP